jgi:Flp pilus assembly protein TadG
LVEVALVLPIILVLAMGMLDFGRAFHTKGLLDQAAREGCRLAVVTAPDVALVQSRVASILATGGVTAGAITVTGPDASRMITVTVNATFTFATPGVFAFVGASFGNTLAMAGQATMRFESGS